jgi:hypothetical protein
MTAAIAPSKVTGRISWQCLDLSGKGIALLFSQSPDAGGRRRAMRGLTEGEHRTSNIEC